MKKIIFLVLASCLLSGCSSLSSAYSSVSSSVSSVFADNRTVDMTYDCSPAGATIFEEGERKLGTCPVTVQYHPNDTQLKEGKFYTKKVTAVWPTGNSVSVAPLAVDIPSNHKASYTLSSTRDMVPVVPPAPMAAPSMPVSSPQAPMVLSPLPPSPPQKTGAFTAEPINASALQPLNPSPPMDNQPAQPTGPNAWDDPMALSGMEPAPPLPKHQNQDFFDSLNNKATCKIDNVIQSVNSGCPPQGNGPAPQE